MKQAHGQFYPPPETDTVNRVDELTRCVRPESYIRWRIKREMTTRKLSANLYICTNMITLLINDHSLPLKDRGSSGTEVVRRGKTGTDKVRLVAHGDSYGQ